MAPPTHAGFTDLPPELMGNVFAFVRLKRDRGAVCLVSKSFRDVMAPMMWTTFSTDLRPTATKALAALLHPNSGILPHVRQLDVLDAVKYRNGDDTLKIVLTALPRNSLRSFFSDEAVPLSTLQVLLYSHRKLTTCRTPIRHEDKDDESSKLGQHITWMRPLISQITAIASWISTVPESTARDREQCLHMVDSCLHLEDLQLSNWDGIDPVVDGSKLDLQQLLPTDPALLKLSNLKTLCLLGMDLESSTHALLSRLDLSILEDLAVKDCINVIDLFNMLTESLSVCPGTLTNLTINLDWYLDEPNDTITSIERFLNATSGLRYISIEVYSHPLIDKDSFSNHCDSLTSLILGTGQSYRPRTYTADDVAHILTKCSKLEGLAINLPCVSFGPIIELAATFKMRPCQSVSQDNASELERMLYAIGSHRTLRTLRMLNMPDIDYGMKPNPNIFNLDTISDANAGLCRVLMQNFASQVMKYLDSLGSRIRLFAAQPSDFPELRPAIDCDGNKWPEYFYLKGRSRDARAQEEAVALPLRGALAEMRGDAVLF